MLLIFTSSLLYKQNSFSQLSTRTEVRACVSECVRVYSIREDFCWMKISTRPATVYLCIAEKFIGKNFANVVKVAIFSMQFLTQDKKNKIFANDGRCRNFSPGENFYIYDIMCLCVCVHAYNTCSTIHYVLNIFVHSFISSSSRYQCCHC